MILDRRRPHLVPVHPQHHAIGEAAGKSLEAQLQPAGIVGDVEDERAVAREGEQDLRALEIVRRARAGDSTTSAADERDETQRLAESRRDMVISLRCSAGSAFDRRGCHLALSYAP